MKNTIMQTRLQSPLKSLHRKQQICREKFLYYFPEGFKDETYLAWERDYKKAAHLEFQKQLNKPSYARLLKEGNYDEIASTLTRLESRTNLLFSFEKMAIRDAVKMPGGAKLFSEMLFHFLYAEEPHQLRFEKFVDAMVLLPRKQTRVRTWPVATVFGFLGNPKENIFLKPRVTRIAAEKYGFNFRYSSQPSWEVYRSLLEFASVIRRDLADLKPRDFIDLQSFIWVMGSDEYPD